MTKRSNQKRLVYILNKLTGDDSQHFVHIPNLLTQMNRLGWNVRIISEQGGEGRKVIFGHEVEYLSNIRKFMRIPHLITKLMTHRWRGNRIVFVRISRSSAFFSSIFGRIFGWKTVMWLSGAVEDFNLKENNLKSKMKFISTWLLFRSINALATGPETMVAYYQRIYRLPRDKIILLYNDIDIDVDIEKLARDPRSQQCNILLVHRLSPVRETTRYFPDLLRALEAHPSASISLTIVGGGPERASLEELVSQSRIKLKVEFLGELPQRSLAQYYRAADIFIMPSFREGFPRVALEAMRQGLPMVATDAGGTADIVGPLQRRFVIDREDAPAFADAVIALLEAPDKRKALSAENLHWVRRFATPKVAMMYDEALSSMIGEGRN